MFRLAPPLVLIAALAAARAHAQTGDRYGPRPAPDAAGAYAPQLYATQPYAPAAPPLRGAPAPQLRTLSWPGKAELRSSATWTPASAPQPGPAPALRSGVAEGRFPGMNAYATPAPALRTGAAPMLNTPSPSSTWPAPSRAAPRRSTPRDAHTPATGYGPAAGLAPAPYARPQEARLASAPYAPAASWPAQRRTASPAAWPPAMPAMNAYAATAAPTRTAQTAAVAPVALPPPVMGRYGYVGPGRDAPGGDASGRAGPAASYAPPVAPQPVAPQPAATIAPSDAASPTGLGPPRPPAYARAYVMPAQAQAAPATGARPDPAAAAAAALRAGDGGRRYSVHREYGMEPDPVPVPPQFFGATADLSTPETAPAALRTKAVVNAARLASGDPST